MDGKRLLLSALLIFGSSAEAAIPKLKDSLESSRDSVDARSRALSSASERLQTGSHSQPTDIRVRVKQITNEARLSGQSLRFTGRLAAGFGHEAILVKWSRASSSAPIRWIVENRDSGKVLADFFADRFDVSGENIRVQLHRVSDRIRFVPSRNKKAIDVVATLDLEDYVLGVLPNEMPASWPLETLKAQAVAARTFALFRRAEREGESYHLESDVMDQVFAHPLENNPYRETLKKAVEETRGVVLRNENGKLIQTFFHADCGGKTEDARMVWGGSGAGTAIDGACPLSPGAVWSVRLTNADLMQRLKKLAGRAHEAGLHNIESLAKTASGRIARLKLAWNDGTISEMSGHEFRMAVGHDVVKSAHFKIEKDQTGFVLKGQGHGHGVGMCQWGAKQLAIEGKNFREILAHYYPRAVRNRVL